MPCDPLDNNINIDGVPPALTPFGLPFGPPQIPFPDLQLPEGIPEDLLDLIDRLTTLWPGGPLVPNLDEFAKNVLNAIVSLLNQIAPYLALYRFLQPLLNLLLCIIDVLCSLLNPFKLRRAMKKLFKRCLPDFLNLFPWLALLAMIIALLLLLLALIEYLINRILQLIQDVIQNLLALADAVGLNDGDRQLAGARKIAQLLCMIEQLFAVLIAFQAILAIIAALANITGRSVCFGGSVSGDDSECCTDEVCPPFIRNNPDGLIGTFGQLIYHKRVNQDTSGFGFPVSLEPLRTERWQFIDVQENDDRFASIITEIDGNIFWPEGMEYESTANLKKVPYLLDMTLEVDPAAFSHPDPIGGSRKFVIKDIIVTKKPIIGTLTFNNGFNFSETNNNGTLFIEGGKVYESDGTTPFIVFGSHATLNTFIHFNPVNGSLTSEDGYFISNTSYTLRFNYEYLLEKALITIGCFPDLQIETTIANAAVPSIDSIINQIGPLPDINATLDCLTTSLDKLRSNLSPGTAVIFQDEVTDCLNDLRDQTITTYTTAVTTATSIFKTTVTLVPTVQFLSQSIKVTVELRDFNGNTISFRVPADAQDTLAAKLKATVTLGEISPFSFDGYQAFEAFITSDEPGTGELTASFNDEILSNIIGQDDDNATTSIEQRVISYQFVGSGVFPSGEPKPVPRRDETDVAGDR